MDISSKLALVTGAGSGMGEAVARNLAAANAKVIVLDLDPQKADQVAAKINGYAVACDVADEQALQQVISDISKDFAEKIQIAVNCAGIAPAKKIVSKNGAMELDFFKQVINVNLIGTFNVMRLVAEQMQLAAANSDSEKGVIINTASIAAFEGQIGQTAYSASKGGVIALTLPAARELARDGIRVMAIAPGLVNTQLLAGLPDEITQSLQSTIPFPKRFGEPKEFAALVAHIINNPYLNGEVIRFDGALRMQAS